MLPLVKTPPGDGSSYSSTLRSPRLLRHQIDDEAYSVPVGALALMLALLGLPNGFPYRLEDSTHEPLSATLGAGIRGLDIQGPAGGMRAKLAGWGVASCGGREGEGLSAYAAAMSVAVSHTS